MIIKRIPKFLSPVRIIGGKSKVLPALHEHLPAHFDEWREGFMGGGSLPLSVMWLNKNARYWLNDGNRSTYAFWKNLHEHPVKMQKWIMEKKKSHPTEAAAENLYHWCRDNIDTADEFEAGCMWFILNRISFNGDGVFTSTEKFSDGQIAKLKCTGDLLQSVDLTITNWDYSTLLSSSSKDVFVNLDPPYSLGSTFLYGDLHRQFDHEVFAMIVKDTKHKFLLTYNDIPEIRQRFDGFNIAPLGMKYKKDGNTAVELVIKNY
jgi:DNA adenine methylase